MYNPESCCSCTNNETHSNLSLHLMEKEEGAGGGREGGRGGWEGGREGGREREGRGRECTRRGYGEREG